MKLLNSLGRWRGYVSSVVVIMMMLLVTADVCGRSIFSSPITGASELARFMMIVIVFPSMAWAALAGKHIKVGLIMDRFPRRVQAIVNSIMLVGALGIYGIITWKSAAESLGIDYITSLIRLPHAPFYWTMTVGWGVFCIAIVALVVKNIAEAVKK